MLPCPLDKPLITASSRKEANTNGCNLVHGLNNRFLKDVRVYRRFQVPNVDRVKAGHGVLLLLSSEHQRPLRVNLGQGKLMDGRGPLTGAPYLPPLPCRKCAHSYHKHAGHTYCTYNVHKEASNTYKDSIVNGASMSVTTFQSKGIERLSVHLRSHQIN